MIFKRIPIIVWIGLATVVLVGVGVWFFTKNQNLGPKDTGKPVPVAKPVEGTVEYSIVGRNHIPQGTPGSGYNSNPPSSGPHWPAPAKAGIYDSQQPDEFLIHNLEHGYVWISYRPDAPDDVKNKLKEIVNGDNWKVVLEPRDKDETQIALVSWGRVLKMDSFDEAKVKDFIKTYRNRGPENTPD